MHIHHAKLRKSKSEQHQYRKSSYSKILISLCIGLTISSSYCFKWIYKSAHALRSIQLAPSVELRYIQYNHILADYINYIIDDLPPMSVVLDKDSSIETQLIGYGQLKSNLEDRLHAQYVSIDKLQAILSGAEGRSLKANVYHITEDNLRMKQRKSIFIEELLDHLDAHIAKLHEQLNDSDDSSSEEECSEDLV